MTQSEVLAALPQRFALSLATTLHAPMTDRRRALKQTLREEQYLGCGGRWKLLRSTWTCHGRLSITMPGDLEDRESLDNHRLLVPRV
jgi:hypothetical protein